MSNGPYFTMAFGGSRYFRHAGTCSVIVNNASGSEGFAASVNLRHPAFSGIGPYHYYWGISEDACPHNAACSCCAMPRDRHVNGHCLTGATKFAFEWYKQTRGQIGYLVAEVKREL